MAVTAKLLQLRPISRPIPNPCFARFFSDEPNPGANSDTNGDATSSQSQTQSQSQSQSQSQPSFSSYFSDVKASLKQQPPPPSHRPSPPRAPFNLSGNTNSRKPPSTIESLEEIRKNLSEFRRRASAPLPSTSGDGKPPSSPSSQHISLEELYKRNVISKGGNNANNTNQFPAGRFSFDTIRESLSQLKQSTASKQSGGIGKANDSISLSRLKDSFKLRPTDPKAKGSPAVIGGSHDLPLSVFGKEMSGKEEHRDDKDEMSTDFLKTYSYEELGQKLKMLRPEKKDGKSGFSLAELNERLIKLREFEKTESKKTVGGVSFKDLRESLMRMKVAEDEQKKSATMQRLNVLGQIGGTPKFMLSPPKDHLVEIYFHPDNMSSAEKIKLELKKVRDEFKMSESDCGSARVQVAQLTTKIKHLSSVLHKKDKHSRKGLLAMVQRRKKLLKYLRRTDWDSYCLVLSKLGLRDNPDIKN